MMLIVCLKMAKNNVYCNERILIRPPDRKIPERWSYLLFCVSYEVVNQYERTVGHIYYRSCAGVRMARICPYGIITLNPET